MGDEANSVALLMTGVGIPIATAALVTVVAKRDLFETTTV